LQKQFRHMLTFCLQLSFKQEKLFYFSNVVFLVRKITFKLNTKVL
jgi:hypothetical protein